MRRDSIIIMGVSAVITIAIVGTGYYLESVSTTATSPTNEESGWTTLKPQPDQPTGSARSMPDVPAGTSPGRTAIRLLEYPH